jgi:Mn-dependent DtxR family transcriptional regulator
MNKTVEQLKGLLAEFFKYYKYKDAITKIKASKASGKLSEEVWDKIKNLINTRDLPKGQALSLIAFDANLPLDEDTDEEAYKWLDLLINNIDNNEIIEY